MRKRHSSSPHVLFSAFSSYLMGHLIYSKSSIGTETIRIEQTHAIATESHLTRTDRNCQRQPESLCQLTIEYFILLCLLII